MREEGFEFGSDASVLFFLDMANSHQGSVEHGSNIIARVADVTKRTGARAMVKLQFRDLETFLHPADQMPLDGEEPLSRHSRRFRETALTKREFAELVRCARSHDLPVYATPFDEASVDMCEELGFDVIKVGSCSAYDWPLLRKVASTKLPVIVSLGGLTANEIDDVVDFFQRSGNPLGLMHCIASYPAPVEDLQLDAVRQLRERYPHLAIGYSGHEGPEDTDVAGLAIAKGAVMLERHVGLPTDEVELNAYSLAPEDVERWIQTAQRAAGACANARPRRPVAGERESLLSLKRGIYARRTIPAGQTITGEDIFLAMPCLEGQFHAGKYLEVVDSYTPMATIYPNMPVGLNLPEQLPRPLILSSIGARVKEMLDEAKIFLDQDVEVEISHQYGLERFPEVGAVIVDVVNRDYCKKLIVQFPRQAHPSHKHIKKEETFQVLAGSAELVLEGKVVRLEAGQKQVIERGARHSFSTETGVIFEEVSTTHYRDDSIYEDESIPSEAPRRKTRIVLPL